MRRDLPYYELPEEVRAVVEDSPKLERCEEFRDADIFAFVKRLKERRCESGRRGSGKWTENCERWRWPKLRKEMCDEVAGGRADPCVASGHGGGREVGRD
jgi:hypothetical protein